MRASSQTVIRSADVLLFPDTDPEPTEATLGRMQTRALIEAAVGELPPDLRLVFLMHGAAGLSLGDIARDLSLPLGTVKTRLMRGRDRLRRIITDRIKGGFETIFPFDGSRCAGDGGSGYRPAESATVLVRPTCLDSRNGALGRRSDDGPRHRRT